MRAIRKARRCRFALGEGSRCRLVACQFLALTGAARHSAGHPDNYRPASLRAGRIRGKAPYFKLASSTLAQLALLALFVIARCCGIVPAVQKPSAPPKKCRTARHHDRLRAGASRPARLSKYRYCIGAAITGRVVHAIARLGAPSCRPGRRRLRRTRPGCGSSACSRRVSGAIRSIAVSLGPRAGVRRRRSGDAGLRMQPTFTCARGSGASPCAAQAAF